MSKRYNLTIEQSATFQHTVNWRAPDGTPIDMTGFRIKLQVRPTPSSSTVLLDFDSGNLAPGQGVEGLDETGSFTITLDDDYTAALSFQVGDYDLTATSPAGTVYRLHEGKASTLPGVTR